MHSVGPWVIKARDYLENADKASELAEWQGCVEIWFETEPLIPSKVKLFNSNGIETVLNLLPYSCPSIYLELQDVLSTGFEKVVGETSEHRLNYPLSRNLENNGGVGGHNSNRSGEGKLE